MCCVVSFFECEDIILIITLFFYSQDNISCIITVLDNYLC